VKQEGRRFGTPLLLALVAAETTDLIFALDSIPAVFAVTDDPFLVLLQQHLRPLWACALSIFVVRGALGAAALPQAGPGGDPDLRRSEDAALQVGRLATGTSLLIIAAILAVALVISLLRPLPPDEQG